MIIIYLGDTSSYLGELACSQDINSRLITDKNIDNLSAGTYYTSIGDVGGLLNLGKILQQSHKIIYAPPQDDNWSGGDMMKYWTEEYLNIFSFVVPVENYSLSNLKNCESMLHLADKRKTKDSQIWIAGCSISKGVGVKNHQRYGQLLSQRLKLSVSFLTCNASSIVWAADQIMRSDIVAGDIVVWGLTSHRRIPYFENDIIHVTSSYFEQDKFNKKRFDVDILTNADTFYRSLISVYQVINFCNKVKANLIIASLLDNDVINYIRDFPNLIILSNLWGREHNELFIDSGSDNSHPGPLTHQFYADKIYQKIISNTD